MSQSPVVVDRVSALADILEGWYERHGRLFPWRTTKNAFQVLVAELLLRKTQAERVRPVYEQICQQVRGAADVLGLGREMLEKLLEPLGLKTRIEWLIGLSAEIVAKHQGQVPLTYEQLVALKGVGPYTANMILCVACDQDTAPVDNNIARLVCRVFGIPRVGDTRREKEVERIVKDVIRMRRAKTIIFAMLDLAALVCVQRNPSCVGCPIRDICQQYASLNLQGY